MEVLHRGEPVVCENVRRSRVSALRVESPRIESLLATSIPCFVTTTTLKIRRRDSRATRFEQRPPRRQGHGIELPAAAELTTPRRPI